MREKRHFRSPFWELNGNYLFKAESSSSNGALWSVWLKLAHAVFLRKRFFLISSMYFRNFYLSPLGKGVWNFLWTNLNPLHLRMLCAKFGWNWPTGSGEDENVKSLRQQLRRKRRTTDKFWSEKLTWAFGHSLHGEIVEKYTENHWKHYKIFSRTTWQ